MSASTLDALLDEDQTFDPVTVDGLSNHLPMGLIGLDRLGADDDQLRRFADGWRDRLVARRAEQDPIGPGDWSAHLGTGRRYGDLVRYFTEAIADNGVVATLDDVLPTLLDGAGGAAFHGIIRLAYALEHGRPSDIACGLACLADVHAPVSLPKGTQPPSGPGISVAEMLSMLAENPTTAGRSRGSGSFSDDFHRVATDATFCDVVAQLAVDATTLGQTAEASHSLYRSSRDFFALHTVTGTHATRIAIDHLTDPGQRIRGAGALARAVAAAYVVVGTPAVAPRADHTNDPGVDSWPAIAAEAISSNDVHVIKMTYSCREEQAFWGDPGYQVTAAEVTGIRDPG